jgi:hypothetical protein
MKYYSNLLPQFNTKAEVKKSAAKPVAIPVLDGNIPPELRMLKQWVLWRWEQRNGEWAKVPYHVSGRYKASTTNPETWGTLEAALLTYHDEYRSAEDRFDGIGFVFKEGDDLNGIDFDQCRFTDGTEKEEVLSLIQSFGSYTELSPTAGGYKTICRVDPEVFKLFNNRRCDYEAYNSGRYFALTGHVLDCPAVKEVTQAYKVFATAKLGLKVSEVQTKELGDRYRPQEVRDDLNMSDREYDYRLKQAQADDKFSRLFSGDWQSFKEADGSQKYPSQSEAVGAFLSSVAFYFGNSFPIANKLFKESKLFSNKWSDGKWERLGREQYAGALTLNTERYTLPHDWGMRVALEEMKAKKAKVEVEELPPGLPTVGVKTLSSGPVGEAKPVSQPPRWKVPSVIHYIRRGKKDYEWIIPKRLRKGVLAFLGADAKAGKTTLVYNTFCDMIVNRIAWGMECGEPIPVIHLDFETDPTFIRQNMFVGRGYGYKELRLIGKHFHATDRLDSDPSLRLPDCLTIDYLNEIVKPYGTPGIIIPDTLRAATPCLMPSSLSVPRTASVIQSGRCSPDWNTVR